MQDLIFIVVSVAFFIAAIGYVTFCDRLKIGKRNESGSDDHACD